MDIIDTFPALPVVKISLVLKEKKRIFSPSFHCKLNGHLLLLLFLWIWKPTCLFFFWSYLISWCKMFAYFVFLLRFICISWFQNVCFNVCFSLRLFGFHGSRHYLDFMVPGIIWISWFFGFHGSGGYLYFMVPVIIWISWVLWIYGFRDYLDFMVPVIIWNSWFLSICLFLTNNPFVKTTE